MSLGSVAGGRFVVFDTNALFLPFTDGTNLDAELERLFGAVEWVIPSSVVNELGNISRGASSSARHAKAALQLAKRIRLEETNLPGDDGILDVARRLKGAIVTGDRKLQEEATKSGLPVVVPRQKGKLALRRSGSG